ncbi:MAG: dihydrolipoyl dehydrogenase [Nitrososphaeria archaeon]
MEHFDVIAFGSGSASNIYSWLLSSQENIRIAVIENGPVGGICLTRGCIPSKMMLYPAELIYSIKMANSFWINAEVNNVNFAKIMEWIYSEVMGESEQIEQGTRSDTRIRLYRGNGEFINDYTVKIGNEVITGDKILLCTGSRPLVPNIPGLEEVGYYTNDNFFTMRKQPKDVIIIGGSYIGLEFGFFLSMMGSRVKILEMLDRIAPTEEPEISYQLEYDLLDHMRILTSHKAIEARKKGDKKVITAEDTENQKTTDLIADEIIVAAGRRSNSDITKPEMTGVKTDSNGWIIVNDFLETTKPNIWACGDSIGKHMFKHAANYESQIVFYNAFMNKRVKVDFHAVPHAIFVQPEVGSVGLKESESRGHVIGYYSYKDTAKGMAMKDEGHFVKVIVEENTKRILGSHIIGPYASSMIHEVIVLMNSENQSINPVYNMMHVHPAVNEVVERAFFSLAEPEYWDDFKENVKEKTMAKRENTENKIQ